MQRGTGIAAAVGAAAGALAGGAAAGAAVGGLTGPVGALLGAAVGAVVAAVVARTSPHADPATAVEPATVHGRIHTVIGAFDIPALAERAVGRLTHAGFPQDDIHVDHPRAGPPRHSIFHGLYGAAASDGVDAARYARACEEAVRRGSTVVVFDARDESQAEHACTLMHELGAVDLMDRAQAQPKVGQRTPGGVRVFQRASARPLRELVRLREQHATTFTQGSPKVRELVPQPVVARTARVPEELRAGKSAEAERLVARRRTPERERAVAAAKPLP